MSVETRFRPNADEVSFTVIDGEAILINLTSGAYYSMTGVAAEVWDRLQRQQSLAEIAGQLVERYDVARERCETELEALVERLRGEGLILPSPGEQGEPPPSDLALPDPPPAWETPTLDVYSDMADLLALDPPTPGLLDNLMRKPEPPEA